MQSRLLFSLQAVVSQQTTKNSKRAAAVKPSEAVKQPTAPAPVGPKAKGTRQMTRGMVPPRPPSVASPPLPLGGVPQDAESPHKPSISGAISRGRSGVIEVQGLLTRQPSVHPPAQARTLSGKVEQLQQQRDQASLPALMSPFAASTAAEISVGPFTHGQSLEALPSLTTGTAGIACIAAPGLDAQKKSFSKLPLSALQERVSRGASALGHLPASAPASRASPWPQGPADSAALSQLGRSSADGLSATQAGAQQTSGSSAELNVADDQDSKAVSTLTNLADESQHSSIDNTRSRQQGSSATLQLSLLDTAAADDDGGEGRQAKPSAVRTAQVSNTLTQGDNQPSMAHLVSKFQTGSSMPIQPSAKAAERVSLELPDSMYSTHSRQGSSQSSCTSRTKSVTFSNAQALSLQSGSQSIASRSALDQEQYESLRSPQALTQQHRALGQEVRSTGSSSGSALVRLSSSLAAAVTQTMQDRMLAGGMMHSQTDNTHADRCPWLRNTMMDPSLAQDRCIWPRSILKYTATKVPSSSESSRVADTANDNVGATRDGRRSMPPQLARHQSSLNQVSRRPDFAAAMNAVRTSWRAERFGQLGTENTIANTFGDEHDAPSSAAHDEQSSLDAIWATIRH